MEDSMKTILSFCTLLAFAGLISFAGETPERNSKLSSAIEVEGLWVIEVFNADGSFDKAYTFENALIGASLFTSFLNSDVVPGGMYMVLSNTQNQQNGICASDCNIGPSSLNAGLTYDSTDFATSFRGNTFETLRLSGNITATQTGTIDQVATWHCICGVNDNPMTCAASPDSCSVVTRRTLPSAVAVNQGQIVQITVDITFQ
jgi:hypothetical protein